MIPFLILVLSTLALVKFAIAQWRAIWLAAASQPLTDALRAATGIDEATLPEQEFGTLIGLCKKLSPDMQGTGAWVREVSVYYRCVAALEGIVNHRVPSFSAWAKREMQTCSRYVAVVLDQTLSMQVERQLASQSHN